jgi:hypothetical protein
MEAISANDNMTMPNPTKVQVNDQKSPANPPSVSPCVFALTTLSTTITLIFRRRRLSGSLYIKINSHVAWTRTVKLIAERRRKFL